MSTASVKHVDLVIDINCLRKTYSNRGCCITIHIFEIFWWVLRTRLILANTTSMQLSVVILIVGSSCADEVPKNLHLRSVLVRVVAIDVGWCRVTDIVQGLLNREIKSIKTFSVKHSSSRRKKPIAAIFAFLAQKWLSSSQHQLFYCTICVECQRK